MLRRCFQGAALVLLAGCAGAPAPDSAPEARGHLVIVGAAIMSGIMITGGEKRPGGDRPVEDASYITIDRDNIHFDEGTAIIVGPDGRWTVAGQSVAVIYDAREATVAAPDSPGRPGAAALRMHVLPNGGVFDPRTGRAALPAAGPAVAGN